MVTIAELLEARGEIAQLEALKKRFITEDELMPILHNRRVAVQDIEQEPAEPSITPEATEKVTPPKNDGFGLEDDKPIPYVPLEDLIAELREDLDLERKKVANLEKKMDLLTSALSAVASVKATSSETRLAKLLVAVFREMEASASA